MEKPRPYDGDRTNGKLDDHVRDVTNSVNFYEARNHWTSQREGTEQVSNYLTRKMHRIYALQNALVSNILSIISAQAR